MKHINNSLSICFSLCILMMLTQCISRPKLDKVVPVTVKSISYQDWNAGTKDGGSGTNVYVELKETTIGLDSIYFRGKVEKLHRLPDKNSVYIARFKFRENEIVTGEAQPSQWPFQIDDYECIIRYEVGSKPHYFKISGIKEAKVINYPMPPPKE